jgi:prolyl oligopeptidase
VPAGDEHYFPKLYYHRLGDKQEKDRLVFEKPTEKEVVVSSDMSWDGRWLILLASKGATNKTEIQVVDLKKPGFKPAMVLPGYEHGYNPADVVNGKLFAWTDRDAPMGRMIVVDLAKIASGSVKEAAFRELVPATKDKLVFGASTGSLCSYHLRNASTTSPCAAWTANPLRMSPCPASAPSAGSSASCPTGRCSFPTRPTPSLPPSTATT